MERGRIGLGGVGRTPTGGNDDNRMAEYMSVAARIRKYYNDLPEVSKSAPVVDPICINRKSRFSTKALRRALAFSLTAGGCGMLERDHLVLAHLLFDIEAAATVGTAPGDFTKTFPTANSFLTETKHEQRRVLALRQWMRVPIVLGELTFTFLYRDALDAGLDALKSATLVSFGPEERQSLEGDGMSRLPSGGDGGPPAWEVAGRGGPEGGSSDAFASIGRDGGAIRSADVDACMRVEGPSALRLEAGASSGSSGAQGQGGSDGGSDQEIVPVVLSRRAIARSGSGNGQATSGGPNATDTVSTADARATAESRYLED